MKTKTTLGCAARRTFLRPDKSNDTHKHNSGVFARANLLLAALAAAGAITVSIHDAFGDSWQTVDDFQYGGGANNNGLAITPGGALFAAGQGDGLTGYHGLIRASFDGGNTWSLLDDFLYPGLNYTVYAAIVADSAGNLYVAGTAYDDGSANGGPNHWIVRRSSDNGATWSMVDDFVPGGTQTQPNAITVDAAGNVYVAGQGDYNTSTQYWTVRKGTVGTNFVTVDNIPGSSFYTALTVFAHPTAGIFAAGEAPVATNRFGGTTSGWLVRRSTNGASSWSTVDAFVLASGYRANPFAIGADGAGNVYVAGRAANKYKGSGFFHWLVRKGTKNGTSWLTDDDYQMYVTGTQSATGFAMDSNGVLYVVGGAGPNWWAGDTDWIVRKKNVGGTGWVPSDDSKFGSYSGAQSIVANSSGNVFVGGFGSDTSAHWLIRKH